MPVFRCGFKPLIHTFTIILSAKATVYCSFLFLQSNTLNCLCHSTLGSIQSASLPPFQVHSTLPFSETTKNTKHYRTVWLLCSGGSVIVTWKGVYVLLRQELLRAGGSKCLFLLVTCNNLTVLIARTGGISLWPICAWYLCWINMRRKCFHSTSTAVEVDLPCNCIFSGLLSCSVAASQGREVLKQLLELLRRSAHVGSISVGKERAQDSFICLYLYSYMFLIMFNTKVYYSANFFRRKHSKYIQKSKGVDSNSPSLHREHIVQVRGSSHFMHRKITWEYLYNVLLNVETKIIFR